MAIHVQFLAAIVTCFLLVTVLLGAFALRGWLSARTESVPIPKITMHILLQATSIVLWIVFIATANTWLAWVSFGLITAGQVLGDLLMFVSYRLRHRATGPIGYLVVARDVLGFSRPVPALHAILGALGWFTMLATCILATIE